MKTDLSVTMEHMLVRETDPWPRLTVFIWANNNNFAIKET